jgi:predicted RNase H-like HicB family nuclease
MKRFITSIALIVLSIAAMAQALPVGVRKTVAQAQGKEKTYEIFAYKDADGATGYYLGLGTPDNIPGYIITFDDVPETCLKMGASIEDVKKNLEDILAFYGSASGTVKSFAARTAVGSRLKESANAQATLQVVFMGGRKILFTYPSKAFTTETYLRRHTVRALLNSLQE